ncbi:hypothetical protein GE061_007768 [Apolygus lucorum]|uniref:Uncharacterized protein n=1 Tax=Apolygus lucorum TaxID=248454 RepID=A0A6A4ISA4_APOLU|nr:hypothetical protein GE061_007768 [Apolygus lucorum]
MLVGSTSSVLLLVVLNLSGSLVDARAVKVMEQYIKLPQLVSHEALKTARGLQLPSAYTGERVNQHFVKLVPGDSLGTSSASRVIHDFAELGKSLQKFLSSYSKTIMEGELKATQRNMGIPRVGFMVPTQKFYPDDSLGV